MSGSRAASLRGCSRLRQPAAVGRSGSGNGSRVGGCMSSTTATVAVAIDAANALHAIFGVPREPVQCRSRFVRRLARPLDQSRRIHLGTRHGDVKRFVGGQDPAHFCRTLGAVSSMPAQVGLYLSQELFRHRHGETLGPRSTGCHDKSSSTSGHVASIRRRKFLRALRRLPRTLEARIPMRRATSFAGMPCTR